VTWTATATWTVQFTGTYSPGLSPIQQQVGSVVLAESATLVMELGGTAAGAEYDQIVAAGVVTLSGSLRATLIDGYVPQAGDHFQIISATGGVSGTFATEDLPALPPGLEWEVQHNATDFTLIAMPAGATILGRHLFYNHSYFDGNDAGASEADDDVIAVDKSALLPGAAATFANYTSYSRGINGIMIDVQGLADPGTLDAAQFEFHVGNSDTPDGWPSGPASTSITVRAGAGVDGSDRLTLIWPDGAIQKQWLQVTVKADVVTGLATPDIFYFGNAYGDSGNSATNTYVDGSDFAGARDNFRDAGNRAPIDFPYDYNRDSYVDGSDMAIARDHHTNFVTTLKLIDLSGSGVPTTAPSTDTGSEGEHVPNFVFLTSNLPNEESDPVYTQPRADLHEQRFTNQSASTNEVEDAWRFAPIARERDNLGSLVDAPGESASVALTSEAAFEHEELLGDPFEAILDDIVRAVRFGWK